MIRSIEHYHLNLCARMILYDSLVRIVWGDEMPSCDQGQMEHSDGLLRGQDFTGRTVTTETSYVGNVLNNTGLGRPCKDHQYT